MHKCGRWCVCVCMRLCACNYSARGWVMDKTLYVWHSYVLRNAASHLSATASTCCIRHVFVLKSPDELINYTHTRTHRGHTPSTTIQESDASLQHSPTHTCTPYSHQSRLTPWCPLCYTGCSDWQAALMPLMAALIEIPHMALVKKTIYSWAIAVVELRPSRPMIKSLGHGIH